MAFRFFADHCVSNYIIHSLQASGHQVLRLRDHFAVGSADPAVIAKAQELDALLLTLNGDFADIISYPPHQYKGIFALQVRDHPEVLPGIMNRLNGFLRSHPSMDQHLGKLIVVEVDRIRIRE